MVVEPFYETISCLFSQFALGAELSCSSSCAGGLLCSHLLALPGGTGQGGSPPCASGKADENLLGCFFEQGRKISLALNNRAFSSRFVFLVLFRKYGLEKV